MTTRWYPPQFGLLVCKPHELFNMSPWNKPTWPTTGHHQNRFGDPNGRPFDSRKNLHWPSLRIKEGAQKNQPRLIISISNMENHLMEMIIFPYLSRKKNIHSPISIAPEFPVCFLGIEPASPSARNSRTVLAAAWQHATESAGAQRLGATARDMESTVAFAYGRRVGIIMKYPTRYVHIQYIYTILCVFVCACMRSIGSSSLFQCRFLFLGVPTVRHTQISCCWLVLSRHIPSSVPIHRWCPLCIAL